MFLAVVLKTVFELLCNGRRETPNPKPCRGSASITAMTAMQDVQQTDQEDV